MRRHSFLLLIIIILSCKQENTLTSVESDPTEKRYLCEINNLIRQEKYSVSEKLIDSLAREGKSYPILAYKSLLNLKKNIGITKKDSSLYALDSDVAKLIHAQVLYEQGSYYNAYKLLELIEYPEVMSAFKLEYIFMQNKLASAIENEGLFNFELIEIEHGMFRTEFERFHYIQNLLLYCHYLRYNQGSAEAITKCHFALSLMESWKLSKKFPSLEAKVLSELSLMHLEEFNFHLADHFMQKAIHRLDGHSYSLNSKLRFKSNLALIQYQIHNDIQRTVEDLSSSLDQYSDASILDKIYVKGSLANALAMVGNVSEAETLLLECLSFYSGIECHSNIKIICNYLAQLYMSLGKTDKALSILEQGLSNANCPIQGVESSYNEVLQYTKAQILIEQCSQTDSLGFCQMANDILTNNLFLNDEYLQKGQNYHLSDMAVYNAVEIIKLNQLRYEITDDDSFLLEAYNQVLKSKNRSLKIGLSNQNDARRVKDTDLKTALLKLNNLKDTISYPLELMENLFDLYNITREDSIEYRYNTASQIEDFGLKQFKALKEYLSEHKAIWLDFFYGEDLSFVFVISPYDIKLKELSLSPDDTEKLVNSIRHRLNKNYIDSISHQVYNQIFFDGDPIAQKILISPDNHFSDLPFEILASDTGDQCRYMIEDFEFSYHFDPVRLYKSDKTELDINRSILYSFSDQDDNPNEAVDSTYKTLVYSFDECSDINTQLENKGKHYTSHEISRLKLINKSHLSILHLATHSVTNSSIIGDNYFVLDRTNNKPEKITGLDIRSSKFKSDFVVLSSCDSGIGQYKTGEGVFSLSREFLNKGSKSVLKSLWKVNDQSTSILMTDFYRYFKSNTLSYSLREAKLKMLRNEVMPAFSHPFYWAAFVIEGDPNLRLQ